MSALDDIYSPENIARSRRRARIILDQVNAGILDGSEWLPIVDEMLAYARERELHPITGVIGSADR